MKNIIKNSFNIMFLIVFGYILYNAIFHNGVNLFTWNGKIVIIGVIINIILLLILYKCINKISKINKNIVILISLLIIFIMQCYIGNLFRVKPNWDMRDLFAGATSYLNKKDGYLPYLYRYSNNIGIQIILIILFKISDTIKIINYYNIGMLFNIIMIDIALLLTFLVSEKLFDLKKAFMIFIILASMTPIYLFVPIIYTDTISMVFPILILYLYLLAKDTEKTKKKCILYILMSITTYIGITIKATTAIITIAIIIYEILKNNKKDLITIISSLTIILIIGILTRGLIIKLVFPSWNNEEYNKQRFPITHWVMMGLGDAGKYSEEDVKYTSSFDTIEEKREKNIKVIKKRLNDILQNDTMNFIRRKLMYTWGDGTYFAVNFLDFDSLNEGIHQEFIFKRGEHHQYYQYYTQIQHLTMITLMLIATMFSLKREVDKNILLRITIFGLFLFLFIWETRSRYLINYLPIMQISAFIGLEELYNFFVKSIKMIKTKNK